VAQQPVCGARFFIGCVILLWRLSRLTEKEKYRYRYCGYGEDQAADHYSKSHELLQNSYNMEGVTTFGAMFR
jgi:hypothetical protein